jgi:phosphoribosylamine--glycine ligase
MAGVANNGEQLVTAGGRVLSVTATGDTLEAARKAAYREMAKVHFDNMHYRRDIGAQALLIGKE